MRSVTSLAPLSDLAAPNRSTMAANNLAASARTVAFLWLKPIQLHRCSSCYQNYSSYLKLIYTGEREGRRYRYGSHRNSNDEKVILVSTDGMSEATGHSIGTWLGFFYPSSSSPFSDIFPVTFFIYRLSTSNQKNIFDKFRLPTTLDRKLTVTEREATDDGIELTRIQQLPDLPTTKLSLNFLEFSKIQGICLGVWRWRMISDTWFLPWQWQRWLWELIRNGWRWSAPRGRRSE